MFQSSFQKPLAEVPVIFFGRMAEIEIFLNKSLVVGSGLVARAVKINLSGFGSDLLCDVTDDRFRKRFQIN